MRNVNSLDFMAPIGRWGRLHWDYIREKKLQFSNDLIKSNMLWSYLDDIDKQAQRRFEELTTEFLQEEITCQIKDQLHFIAEEIVLVEIVYKIN